MDLSLIQLPDVVLEKIFSFLSYDRIAQLRIVCTRFNDISGKMLNKGYYLADKFHAKTLKEIKARLPRRESERRVHPLSRQCDVLIAIETRLSMLSMTYTKWMDAKLCCFIPGKVIDEIMRVLRTINHCHHPPRTYEILQELRDISSMAMEHFDEKILPTLKSTMGGVPNYIPGLSRVEAGETLPRPPPRIPLPVPPMPMPKTISPVEFHRLAMREAINRRKLKAQAAEISELRRHVEEWEAKLHDIVVNLTKTKELPSTSTAIVPPCQNKRKNEVEMADSDNNKKAKLDPGPSIAPVPSNFM